MVFHEAAELIGGHVVAAAGEPREGVPDVGRWARLRDLELALEALEHLVAVVALRLTGGHFRIESNLRHTQNFSKYQVFVKIGRF